MQSANASAPCPGRLLPLWEIARLVAWLTGKADFSSLRPAGDPAAQNRGKRFNQRFPCSRCRLPPQVNCGGAGERGVASALTVGAKRFADKESGDKSPPCPALLHNSTQNLNHEEQTVFPLSDPARRKPALPCPVRPEIRERRSACLPIRSMLLLCKIYSLTFCVCYQTKQSCAVNRNMLKDLSLFIYLFQYIINNSILHICCAGRISNAIQPHQAISFVCRT